MGQRRLTDLSRPDQGNRSLPGQGLPQLMLNSACNHSCLLKPSLSICKDDPGQPFRSRLGKWLRAWRTGMEISTTVHEKAWEWFDRYQMVGGMPAVVAADAGGAVPGDLAALGVGDFREAQMGIPGISTIAQPGRLVGSAALAMVHRMLQRQQLAERKVIIPTPPVTIRQSTVAQVSANAPVLLAREWIYKRACEGLTVNDLVELVPMSQHTFSKGFSELFGHTPGEAIRQVRCERAQHYPRATNLTVERIGELCGYSDSARFGNFFKRVTGTSPGQYQRSNMIGVKSGDCSGADPVDPVKSMF